MSLMNLERIRFQLSGIRVKFLGIMGELQDASLFRLTHLLAVQ